MGRLGRKLKQKIKNSKKKVVRKVNNSARKAVGKRAYNKIRNSTRTAKRVNRRVASKTRKIRKGVSSALDAGLAVASFVPGVNAIAAPALLIKKASKLGKVAKGVKAVGKVNSALGKVKSAKRSFSRLRSRTRLSSVNKGAIAKGGSGGKVLVEKKPLRSNGVSARRKSFFEKILDLFN